MLKYVAEILMIKFFYIVCKDLFLSSTQVSGCDRLKGKRSSVSSVLKCSAAVMESWVRVTLNSFVSVFPR